MEESYLFKLLAGIEAAKPYKEETIIQLASNHNYECRCSICLRYWTLVGPEKVGEGFYSFGPFTVEEFTLAGGTLPEDYLNG